MLESSPVSVSQDGPSSEQLLFFFPTSNLDFWQRPYLIKCRYYSTLVLIFLVVFLIQKEDKYRDDYRDLSGRVFPLTGSNCQCQAAEDTWCSAPWWDELQNRMWWSDDKVGWAVCDNSQQEDLENPVPQVHYHVTRHRKDQLLGSLDRGFFIPFNLTAGLIKRGLQSSLDFTNIF